MKLTIHGKKTIQSTNLHRTFFENEVKRYGNKKQIITPLEKARSLAGNNHFILEFEGNEVYNSFKEKNRGSSRPVQEVKGGTSSQRTHGHHYLPGQPLGHQPASGHPKPKKKISFR